MSQNHVFSMQVNSEGSRLDISDLGQFCFSGAGGEVEGNGVETS